MELQPGTGLPKLLVVGLGCACILRLEQKVGPGLWALGAVLAETTHLRMAGSQQPAACGLWHVAGVESHVPGAAQVPAGAWALLNRLLGLGA